MPRQGEPAREHILVDRRRFDFAACDRFGGQACGVGDIPATTIVDRHIRQQRRICAGLLHRLEHARMQVGRKRGKIADELDAHTVAMQLIDLAIQRLQEQLHQGTDLILRTLPVFA